MKNLKRMTPSICLLFSLFFTAFTTNAQNVDIPDAQFKARLISNHLINTNGDNEIQLSESEVYTGSINVSNSTIQSMEGIQYFPRITSINCADNEIMYLDLTNNTQLVRLNCSNNKIFELELSNQVDLRILNLDSNLLNTLILESNAKLIHLSLNNNQIQTLDVVQNTELQSIDCSYNDIEILNLSQNTDLVKLNCSFNSLEVLNLKNGNNHSIMTSDFDATNNNLNCIEVDDLNFSNFNWTSKIDAGAYFSTNCTALPIKEVSIGDFTLSPNPTSGAVTIFLGGLSERVAIEVFNTSGGTVVKNSYNNKDVINIDLDVIPGIYMVTVNTYDGNNFTKKLFVQ